MELKIRVTEKKGKEFCKTASDLVNAVCGLVDTEFDVEYIDHSLEADESLVDDSDDRD